MGRSSAPASSTMPTSPVRLMGGEWNGSPGLLKRPSSGNELHDQHDDGDDQQQMYQRSPNMQRESAEPHDDEDHDDEPEQVAHCRVPFTGSTVRVACLRMSD